MNNDNEAHEEIYHEHAIKELTKAFITNKNNKRRDVFIKPFPCMIESPS